MSWRGRRFAVLLLATSLGVGAACDEPIAVEPSVLPVRDVSVPWQPIPFRVRDEVLARAVQGCRMAMNFMPPAAMTTLADIRGSNRISLMFATPNEHFTCMAVANLDGGFDPTSASGGSGGPSDLEPIGPGLVRPRPMTTEGGLVDVNGEAMAITTIDGRVGPDVVTLDITLESGVHLQATVGGGWFAAWWPSGDAVQVIQAFDANGQALGRAGTP